MTLEVHNPNQFSATDATFDRPAALVAPLPDWMERAAKEKGEILLANGSTIKIDGDPIVELCRSMLAADDVQNWSDSCWPFTNPSDEKTKQLRVEDDGNVAVFEMKGGMLCDPAGENCQDAQTALSQVISPSSEAAPVTVPTVEVQPVVPMATEAPTAVPAPAEPIQVPAEVPYVSPEAKQDDPVQPIQEDTPQKSGTFKGWPWVVGTLAVSGWVALRLLRRGQIPLNNRTDNSLRGYREDLRREWVRQESGNSVSSGSQQTGRVENGAGRQAGNSQPGSAVDYIRHNMSPGARINLELGAKKDLQERLSTLKEAGQAKHWAGAFRGQAKSGAGEDPCTRAAMLTGADGLEYKYGIPGGREGVEQYIADTETLTKGIDVLQEARRQDTQDFYKDDNEWCNNLG